VDFSVANLATTFGAAITFTVGGTALGANVSSVYIENTSGTPVAIATGAPASPQTVDISPINNNVYKAFVLNKAMQVFLKSLGAAAITTGKFTICFYN
jgi:hypothetical protein